MRKSAAAALVGGASVGASVGGSVGASVGGRVGGGVGRTSPGGMIQRTGLCESLTCTFSQRREREK